MISRLYFLFFVLSIFANVAKADTHDYIIERSYFEDKTCAMSFEQAKNVKYSPIGQILSKGYSHSAFWIRLKIAAAVLPPEHSNALENKLILRIQPTYLDSVYLFDPLEPSTKPRVVGDKHPLSFNESESLNFNFVIPKAEQPRYVWLRLTTASTNFLHVQALDIKQASHLDRLQEMIFAFYIGILFFLFFLPLIIWFLRKELLVGMFVLKQFGALIMLFFYAGYFRVLFKDVSPLALELAFNIDLLIYSVITIVFHYFFLCEYKLNFWAKYYFIFAALCFPVELVLLLHGDAHTALKLNMNVLNGLSIALIVIPFFGIAWKEMDRPIFSKKWLVAIHILMFFFAAMTILPSLGYFQGNAFSPMAGMTYGGITGVIFLFVLQYRYRVNRDTVVAELSSATAYANSEKQRREEQGRFLEMLTHEIKTSLSVLRMAIGSGSMGSKEAAYAEQAIEGMNDVIDRCSQAQEIADQHVTVSLTMCKLKSLLDEVIERCREPQRVALVCDPSLNVESDLKLLKIIFSNLIDNAIKYSVIQSPVSVTVTQSGQLIHVRVSNQVQKGRMPNPDLVFTKYYRASSAQHHMGSGLGLYLTAHLVDMLGLKLNYTPKENTVEFDLCLMQST